jgi:hypothetical protein
LRSSTGSGGEASMATSAIHHGEQLPKISRAPTELRPAEEASRAASRSMKTPVDGSKRVNRGEARSSSAQNRDRAKAFQHNWC